MPNHVTNILKLSGDDRQIQAMLEAIKSDEYGIGSIDFNKIIPMPQSLRIEAGSKTDRGLRAYKDFIEVYTLGGTIEQDLLNIPIERENAFLRMRGDISRDDWNLGRTVFRNEQLYHAPTWYEWSIANWGTKWNAYGYSESGTFFDNGETSFLTAWSAPHPIISALAEKYPDIEFVHEWADEDIGQNCGRFEYENGERIEEYYPESKKEAIEFAAKVMDADPNDWGLFLNISENNYICLSEDELEKIELLGQTALFTDERLTADTLPKGVYCYHLRHSDDVNRFATIEPNVAVNHGGTVITKEPIIFGEKGYIAFDDDFSPNFLGDHMTVEEFMNTDFTQSEDESQTMGGMRL